MTKRTIHVEEYVDIKGRTTSLEIVECSGVKIMRGVERTSFNAIRRINDDIVNSGYSSSLTDAYAELANYRIMCPKG